jgi:hypothetical protein
MNNRRAKLRRLAARARLMCSRLDALADDLKSAGFPMCAKDVRRYAACCLSLSMSFAFVADQDRNEPEVPEP